MKLLVATTNPGKLSEIAAFLAPLRIDLLSLNDLDGPPAVVEDGETYEANALKKARTLAAFSGLTTLGDDSGLAVDALGGAPGVHSARYSGPEADDARNNAKLLGALAGVPEAKRSARFVCVLALCVPGVAGAERLFRAECPGRIAFASSGTRGFGYDPLFFYPPLGQTFGQLAGDVKSRVSHRGLALQQVVEAWPRLEFLHAPR
jgi:XTP/dITP diphosphohydrolase